MSTGQVIYDPPTFWIGDFPPPNLAPVPYAPFAPSPNLVSSPYGAVTLACPPVTSPWRMSLNAGVLSAAIDMPGILMDDLTVEIKSGTLKVAGVRFDTKQGVSYEKTIGNDYDPKSAVATLCSGVLTIAVKAFVDTSGFKVPITAK
jgi:hypothetical protein